MLIIVDYGMGNLRSLGNAIEEIGYDAEITADPDRVQLASKIFLPGVGAIGEAMRNLSARGLTEAVRAQARDGVPVLGICLGMQLMATRSFEGGEYSALGWIDGDCLLFDAAAGIKVPHIGWNAVVPRCPHPLLAGIEPGTDFYFVHSYHLACRDENDILASSEHGRTFTAACGRDHVMGVQFHPEKSQAAGLAILRNFLAL